MTIKNTLNKILGYYSRNRQVGHTAAMLNIKTTEQPIILIKERLMSNYIDKLLFVQGTGKKLKYISLDNIDELYGRNAPLLIDHYTLQDIFTKSMEEIMLLEVDLNNIRFELHTERKNTEKLEKEIEVLKDEKFKLLITGRLCLTGIDNLINKNNFLQLCIQLAEKFITEEEFQTEVETNFDNYAIKPLKPLNETELSELVKIVKNFHREFMVHEVEEIFSVSNL